MRFLAICIWYLVYGECKYATGLSLHAISYFILFYLLRLFIYLLCAVLKAQIKESPRHRLGQSRLHSDGPQWGRAGFIALQYCSTALLGQCSFSISPPCLAQIRHQIQEFIFDGILTI